MNADELRAALSAYMKRTDPETIANEPTALELSRLLVGVTFFPHESETVVPSLAIVDGEAPLPDDFGRAVAVAKDFAYTAPRVWRSLQGNARELAGRFTVYGGALHVHPALTEVSLVYNRQPEAIVGTASNWLSELYPQVWLHAARAEQYRFIEDTEGAMQADGYWRGLAQELAAVAEVTRQAGGLIRMKSR